MVRILSVAAAMTLVVIGAREATAQAPDPGAQRKVAGAPRGPGERFNPLLRMFDGNRDGVLTPEEINAAASRLKGLDVNKDDQLTGEELRAAMPAPPEGPGRGFGGPGGPPPGGPGRGEGASASAFEKAPVPKNDREKALLAAIDEMRGGPRFANVPTPDGRLLRLLAESTGAKRIVEIGTSTGESAVWFAMALEKTGGHLYTHEIDEGRAKVAQESFKKAGVDDRITLILGDAHETVKQHTEPIDILFLDADKEGYIDYLEKLLPKVRPGGLIIAHNMNARQADPRYVKFVTESPDLESSFLLMEGTGVGVTLKKH